VHELERIVSLEVVGPGETRVRFSNGEEREVIWKNFADTGTPFEKLKDPTYACSHEIIEDGIGLEWPDGVDWSAGAVYVAGVTVSAPSREPVTTA
jgi:hypothetical protein